ncbi:MAG TPA: peptidoglycan-binding domain-containing protein [Polyangiaceae bacterium]|nr:peptidoglycan-binding domain-containing protein [Polyangiaceae bacterium]
MKHVRFWLGLSAPAMLLGAASALAQQTMPPRATDPSGVNEANQTRELEGEIEQYPGPADGVRNDGAPDSTSIPEKMQPAPNKPSQTPRPHAATSASPARQPMSGASSIDPSEVQRVFGSDARVVALGSLDAASITRLQVRLHELGHYKGTIDGILGPQTRAAIESYAKEQFALKQRLLKQDQLTTDLADQLGVQPSPLHTHPPANTGDMGPSMHGDAPLLPPGGAPTPPPSMAPLPTPSSTSGAVPPPRPGSTPATPPPSP